MTNPLLRNSGKISRKNKPSDKPRGRPFKKKDPITGAIDPRINLEGAPKKGATYRDVYGFYDDLTADIIAEMLPKGSELRKMYEKMPKGIEMKHLKAIRIFAAIMFDPTAGLVKEVSDRTEGKVAERIQLDGNLEVDGLDAVLNLVYGKRNVESEDQS